MKHIDRLMMGARGARRRWAAQSRWLTMAGSLPGRIEPSSLFIDLSRGWDGAPAAAPMPADTWRDLLVAVVEWLGPVPVHVQARARRLHEATAAVVRFARRLECPVTLVGPGGGIDLDLAFALADAGLERATLVVGGVSPGINQETAGSDLEGASNAVLAFLEARDARQRDLDVVVQFPCSPVSAPELASVEGWARQVSADGFQITAPLLAPAGPTALDPVTGARIHRLEKTWDRFHRTQPGTGQAVRAVWAAGDGEPGAVRTRGGCPIAGIRLSVRADGAWGTCPFKPAAGHLGGSVGLREGWLATWPEHVRMLRTCPRACFHPQLVPAFGFHAL